MTSTRKTRMQEALTRLSGQIADLSGEVEAMAQNTARLEGSPEEEARRLEDLERTIGRLERIQDEMQEILQPFQGEPKQRRLDGMSSDEVFPSNDGTDVERLGQLAWQIDQLAETVSSTKDQINSHHEWLHRVSELAGHASRQAEMLWSSKPWQAYLRMGRLRRPQTVELPNSNPDSPSPAPTPTPTPTPLVPKPTSGMTEYLPYCAESDAYIIPRKLPKPQISSQDGLPLPPGHLMLGHASEEEFISWGEQHVGNMRRLLAESGFQFKEGNRVLDFGCGSGRMLRHFHSEAATGEFWGVDIRSEHIIWCRHHLSPPLRFAVTTTLPHLPFEDRHFDLIYAGSVFTHIDDLADAWFLELRRVLKPGGTLYVTIHDHHSMQMLLDGPPDGLAYEVLSSHGRFEDYARSDYSMFTLWRSADSQVFYDFDYIRARLELLFDFVTHSEEAYGFQTAVIVRKPREI